jgi:hypothetical protein
MECIKNRRMVCYFTCDGEIESMSYRSFRDADPGTERTEWEKENECIVLMLRDQIDECICNQKRVMRAAALSGTNDKQSVSLYHTLYFIITRASGAEQSDVKEKGNRLNRFGMQKIPSFLFY